MVLKVDVLIYAVEKSLDSYKFNLLQNKQLFINQLKTNNMATRTIDEGSMDEKGGMNFSEYVAILSGNTELLEKARLEKNGTATSTCFENDKQPDHPKTTNTESAFLARAIEQVEKNMHVIGYSVEQLSRDLCMERTGLYRKLVNLLDQSPSLFIRNIRLQRAAQLLTENELSIAEIAERTGFSSSSYLSKCFQEMYGCRPSEYARKTKKST